MIAMFLLYLIATILKSDLWGNLLSPVIALVTAYIIYKAFFIKEGNRKNRINGLLISTGIAFWAVADILWAVYDLVFHINPENIDVIAIGYAITNLCLTLSFSIYSFRLFRKWNMVQILLDTVAMSYFVIDLIWIVFLNQDVKNILELRCDWISTTSIILDIFLLVCIAICYMSVRNGKLPVIIRFIITGTFLFTITDLIYFYQYLYSKYEPNTILDAVYMAAFQLIAIAAILRLDGKEVKIDYFLDNTGRSAKGYFLLLGPVIIVAFRGPAVTSLLQFVTVALIYFILTNYIQNNINKERLLHKEHELNTILEQKVRSRTEELEEKNRVLERLLDQDFITGLSNRRFLESYLEKAIAALEDGERILLLYIDINRFKMITTMFGHYIGDMLLYEMAEKLRPLVKPEEHSIITSYGDDTYIFVAIGPYNYQKGYELAQEAIKLCSDNYRIEDYQIRATVNIGISLFPSDASTKEELIKHADIAMTQARMKSFNEIQIFDAKLSERIFRRNTIEIMLKQANFNQEFMVYYQPELLIDTKRIIGFEALLRWKTPQGEMVGPSEFIPVAEETGYISSIGDWVMMMVMKQIVDWNRRFQVNAMIGINVSLKQLNSLKFVDRLKEEILRLGIQPEWIDLEITESLQLQENPEIIKMLSDIRSFGVKISIDDFGTGYSSLSYFKDLPADRIKLAKELIDTVHIDNFGYKLVQTIILLSKAKGIRVIAEGVETKEQWEVLKELNCDEVQGYYFGKPAPVSEIEALYL